MRNWNYAGKATYFLTICTHNRILYFGSISQGINHLSALGNIVKEEWLKTPNIRPDMNISLDAFVVMPNHFHAIIGIGHNIFNQAPEINISTFGPQRKSLASIFRMASGILRSNYMG
jgi:putative transposase